MMYTLPLKSKAPSYLLYVFFTTFFCIGIVGYLQKNLPFVDALYNTIKLVTLNGEEHVDNWQLELARFALPLFTVVAIVKLFLQTIGLQVTYLTLRLFPAKTIVFGTTATAVEVSIRASHLGKRLFIDISPHGITYQEELPAKHYKLLRLPELSHQQLTNLPFHAAQHIYFIGLQDEVNLALAKSIIPLLEKSPRKPPHLFINITGQLMQRMANNEPLFHEYRKKHGELTWINSVHQLARTILQQRPPLNTSSLQHEGPLHIGLLGFTSLTRQLILSIMRNGAYLNIHQLHISILSQNEESYVQFIQKHPILSAQQPHSPLFGTAKFPISLQHHVCSIPHISPQLLLDIINQKGHFQHIYIHDESDYLMLEMGHKTRQILTALELPFAMTTCLGGRDIAYIDALNQKIKPNLPDNQDVFYFSIMDHYTDFANKQGYDILPLIIHTAYHAIQSPDLPAIKSPDFAPRFAQAFLESIEPAQKHWRESLQENFRHSSRCAADHLFIKLKELGFELRYQPARGMQNTLHLAQLHCAIHQHLEDLLQVEHQRFYQERVTDGWLYATQNDETLQLHSSLVAFDQLSEQALYKDECLIRLIPFILAQPKVQAYYQLIKVD
ncbi:hypothetical protein [Pasteurella sp. PK-2025]|uniref:hypothetical protein n=1 Tax=unclassified Pasteurella TaxID=2621516 RepID=UPI003C75B8A9